VTRRRVVAKEQTKSTERVTRPSADPTRDRIRAAAADFFSDRSLDGATMHEIAPRMS
jgi:AcrR family transcriptional regulator